MSETTALGAAIAAGFAVGIWRDFDELDNINKADRAVFHPSIPPEKSNAMFGRWNQAVKMARGWDQGSSGNDQK